MQFLDSLFLVYIIYAETGLGYIYRIFYLTWMTDRMISKGPCHVSFLYLFVCFLLSCFYLKLWSARYNDQSIVFICELGRALCQKLCIFT